MLISLLSATGMDRLQRSMNAYVKWLGRRSEALDDGGKGLPVSCLGRTMLNHGEDFEPDSEFGNCLITMGRANERVASIQDHFVADATTTWLESLERSLAMMKEYQVSILAFDICAQSEEQQQQLTPCFSHP